ncbi:MAG: PilZ domain-containing protein [Pseudomonadales bacterium]
MNQTASQKDSVERRRYARRAINATVLLSHPAFGTIKSRALDMSDGGLYVDTGFHIAPPIGTILQVTIKRHTGPINDQPIDMQVAHKRDGGLGLKFV